MKNRLKSASSLTKYPVYNEALTFHYSVYLNHLNGCKFILNTICSYEI